MPPDPGFGRARSKGAIFAFVVGPDYGELRPEPSGPDRSIS